MEMEETLNNDEKVNTFLKLLVGDGLKAGTIFLAQYRGKIKKMGIDESDSLTQGKPITEEVDDFKHFPKDIRERTYFKREDFKQDEQQHYKDVYFAHAVYNPYGNGKRDQENVMFLTSLYVDLDNCSYKKAKKRINRLPESFREPTAIINSGTGIHVYWVFDWKYKDKEYKQKWLRTMRELRDRLNGDPKVIDTARLMRVPGTWNKKQKKPCKFIKFDKNKTFNFLELSKALGTYYSENKRKDYPKNNGTNATKKDKKKATNKKEVSPNNYTRVLIKELETLAQMRAKHNNDIGCRHTILYALAQLTCDDSYLDYINSVFSEPLSENEGNNIKTYRKEKWEKHSWSAPTLKNLVTKLDLTAEEQTMFKYLIDSEVYEVTKQCKKLQQDLINKALVPLILLLEQKYAKRNVPLKQLASDLEKSTKTVATYKKKRRSGNKVNELQDTLDFIVFECRSFPILSETTDSKQPGIDRVRTLQKQTAAVQSIVDKSINYRKKELRKGEYEDLLELIREAVDLKESFRGA